MAEPMSAARLAEIKARVEAADAGPWTVDEMLMVESDAGAIGDFYFHPENEAEFAAMKADADFAAAARNDVPDLLAEVDRLRDRVEELEPFEPHLREMHMGPGGWSMTIQQAKSASGAFVAAAKAMLDGYDAENYVEQEVFLGATTKERYMIIYVRPGKKGPHQLRREAEAEVDRLRTRVAELEAWANNPDALEDRVREIYTALEQQDGGAK